jgi:hypothetical protein
MATRQLTIGCIDSVDRKWDHRSRLGNYPDHHHYVHRRCSRILQIAARFVVNVIDAELL